MTKNTQDYTFCGVDISKDKFDICVLGGTYKTSKFASVNNSLKGFNDFLDYFKNTAHLFVGYESTGNYMRNFQRFLADNDISNVLLNARRVKNYSKYVNLQGKTDKKDSFMLAKLISTLDTDEFNCSYSIEQEQFTKMFKTLNHLTEQRKRLRSFKKSLNYGSFDISAITDETYLNETIKKLHDDCTKQFYKAYPVAKRIRDEVKGVGDITLMSLVPVIYDSVGVYTREQITAYIGLNPVQFESGYYKGKTRLNMFGKSSIKKYLYLSAVSASRFNKILSQKYQQLLERDFNKVKAFNVIARKVLLVVISYIKEDKIKRGLIIEHKD